MVGQPGFFDLDERYRALAETGDPLIRLAELIEFEVFRVPQPAHGGPSARGSACVDAQALSISDGREVEGLDRAAGRRD
jgi:hypothetical protein